MENNCLKNIVVLKDLPSNIVDEAIVILKPNNKLKKVEIVENNKMDKILKKDIETDKHILNEAEMLVTSYISKLEKKRTKKKAYEVLRKKYKRLKKYTIILSCILVISIILSFI